MEFTGTKVKEQQPLENTFDKQLLERINNELNKTFSSESVWTRDSISSWLDEGRSETWSMVDLVQEMETRSANAFQEVEASLNPEIAPSLSLSLDGKSSDTTNMDSNACHSNSNYDIRMYWNQEHKIM